MLSGGARRLAVALRAQAGQRAPWWRRSTTAGSTPRSRCIDAGVELACRGATCGSTAAPSRRARSSASACELLSGATVLEATRARAGVERGDRPARASNGQPSARFGAATCWRCPAAARPPPRCCPGRRARRATTSERGHFTLAARARGRARGRPAHRPRATLEAAELSGSVGRRRGGARARTRRRGLARARREGPRAASTAPRPGPRERRRAAAGHERAQRQVLRLPLRGRDREGHPPRRSRRATTRSSSPSATRPPRWARARGACASCPPCG